VELLYLRLRFGGDALLLGGEESEPLETEPLRFLRLLRGGERERERRRTGLRDRRAGGE